MMATRIKVLDYSTHISGPFASRLLADLGADVVKMENPSRGDGNRGTEPRTRGESVMHLALNPRKRSVAFDWTDPQWPEIFRASAIWADVVLVGGTPSAVAQRGLDFKSFVAVNPNIVHCLITGYGDNGPWCDNPSHGLNADVLAGVVPIDIVEGTPSVRDDFRTSGSTLAGYNAALGILEALRRRDQGLGPQRVTASLWESALFWNWRDSTMAANSGERMTDYRDMGSRYAIYQTADKRFILLCPIEQKFWQRFCRIAELPAGYAEKGSWHQNGMDYGDEESDEREVIARSIRRRSAADWEDLLGAEQVPFAFFLTLEEALASEQAQAVGAMKPVIANDRVLLTPSVPIRVLSGDHARPDEPQEDLVLPELGSSNDQFMAEIGLQSVLDE